MQQTSELLSSRRGAVPGGAVTDGLIGPFFSLGREGVSPRMCERDSDRPTVGGAPFLPWLPASGACRQSPFGESGETGAGGRALPSPVDSPLSLLPGGGRGSHLGPFLFILQ
jgi:hypothetical protein